MNVSKLTLSFEAIAKAKTGKLVDARTLHPFVDGHPTSEVIGAEYDVILENVASEKINVKVENGALPIINGEDIKPTDRIEVAFTDFAGRLYKSREGRIELSTKAKGITIVSPNTNKV